MVPLVSWSRPHESRHFWNPIPFTWIGFPSTRTPVNPFSEIASFWKRSVCEPLWTRIHKWNGMVSKCGFSLAGQNRAIVYQITGGILLGILGGGCAARLSKSWHLFQTKKCHFPHPFSDLNSNLYPFSHLGKAEIMPSLLRLERQPWKRFLDSISNSHLTRVLSHLFGIWNDKYVHALPYSPRKPYPIPD